MDEEELRHRMNEKPFLGIGVLGFILVCILALAGIASAIDIYMGTEYRRYWIIPIVLILGLWSLSLIFGGAFPQKAEKTEDDPLQVNRTDQKTLYGAGIVILLLSAMAMLLVWQIGSTFGGYVGTATLVLSILGLIAGVKIIKVGHNAIKKYAEDVGYMTQVAQSLLAREVALVETSLVRHKLLMQHEFDQRKMQHELSLMDERLMTEQAKGQLDRKLIRAASGRGVDVSTYLLLEKTLELDRMELDKQWALAEQKINAAIVAQQVKSAVASGLTPQQHLQTLREYINSLYHQSETTTDREKALLEKHIKFMESDFSARQKLIQADTRGKLRGSD